MTPLNKNIRSFLFGSWYPVYKKQYHGGDYVFDITNLPGSYTGYTRDKNLFHIYNPATNAFASYEGLNALIAWVTTAGPYVSEKENETRVNENGQFISLAPGGSVGMIVLGLAGLGLLTLWALKK